MEKDNVTDLRLAPGRGWVIALCNGVWFIGKRAGSSVMSSSGGLLGTTDPNNPHVSLVLEPVYELIHMRVPKPGGDVTFMHTVAPVLCFPGIKRLGMPGALVIEVESLSDRYQHDLMAACGRADKMETQIRARALGIQA